MESFNIKVKNLPKEGKRVEVYYDDERFADVFMEDGEVMLELYPSHKKRFFELPLDEAIETLEKAKGQLLKL